MPPTSIVTLLTLISTPRHSLPSLVNLQPIRLMEPDSEVRARIDEEIAVHALSIRELCARRNTLSPACCLPSELLANIFIHCALNHHNYPRYSSTKTVPSWVNISYVCRYWRSVALDCPTLWTYHFVASLRWTEELLARSKQAPLRIRIVSKRRSWRWGLIEKLIDHAERIQEFDIEFPKRCNNQILSQLSSPAPRLQNLKISAHNTSSSRPLVLFDGDTPALRTLELSGCPVLWSSFKPNALTTLCLYRVPEKTQQNTEEFLATLSHMQDLEHLYLDNALARAPGFPSSAAGEMKISLPYLSRLLIAAPLSTVIALLSCINNPSKTQLRLCCFPENDTSLDNFTRLCSVLAQRFTPSEDQVVPISIIRSLLIRTATVCSSGAGLTFSALERDCTWDSIPMHMDWGSNIPLRINFKLNSPMTMSKVNHVISEICSFMPLANVRSAHVIDPPFSPAFWRKLLGRLQELPFMFLPGHQHMRDRSPGVCSVNKSAGFKQHRDYITYSEKTRHPGVIRAGRSTSRFNVSV